MANVLLTTADDSGFIPQDWANRALEIFRANIVVTKHVARDFDYEPGWRGKTLTIPYVGSLTAVTKPVDGSGELTPAAPSGNTKYTVTLSTFKTVDILVEDFARAQQSSEIMDRYVEPAGIALANAVEDSLFALYSSFSSIGGASAIDHARILSALETFDNADIPSGPGARVGVIYPTQKKNLLATTDTMLQNWLAFSKSDNVAKGYFRELEGFDLYTSTRVPLSTTRKNLFFYRDAMILAVRPFAPIPEGSGVRSAVITDPESGLSIRVLWQYHMGYRGVRMGFDILYGVAAMRTAAGLQVLTS